MNKYLQKACPLKNTVANPVAQKDTSGIKEQNIVLFLA